MMPQQNALHYRYIKKMSLVSLCSSELKSIYSSSTIIFSYNDNYIPKKRIIIISLSFAPININFESTLILKIIVQIASELLRTRYFYSNDENTTNNEECTAEVQARRQQTITFCKLIHKKKGFININL